MSLLCLGLLVFLGQEAVSLHQHTVCRQEAWRSSVTLHTRTLLSKSQSIEKDVLLRCGILVSRKEKLVIWTRGIGKHVVPLKVEGSI